LTNKDNNYIIVFKSNFIQVNLHKSNNKNKSKYKSKYKLNYPHNKTNFPNKSRLTKIDRKKGIILSQFNKKKARTIILKIPGNSTYRNKARIKLFLISG